MIRPLPFLFALGAVGMLTACGDDNPGETRVIVIDDQPELIDAARTPPDAGDAVLIDALAQGLVRFDARGQVVPGLAERWHVSNDGRSYIFRLGAASWADGQPVVARDVAQALERLVDAPRHPLRDALQNIDDVVAMTDRVIEIRLSRPQAGLLSILAQPELGIISRDGGSGPFLLGENEEEGDAAGFHLSRLVTDRASETSSEEVVHLTGLDAQAAIAAYLDSQADLVLGGGFATLPYAQNANLPGGALQFDPVRGLFGLVPMRNRGPLADRDFRRALSRSVDRAALINDLGVPGLTPRATILQNGLVGDVRIASPAWLDTPVTERQAAIAARLRAQLGPADAQQSALAKVSVFLPAGPGSDILFNRLAADWGRIGVEASRTESAAQADYALIDVVAPSTGLDWFVNRFRCARAAICDEAVELLFEQADSTDVPDQRQRILIDASAAMDRGELFIPLTAPIRWSLASPLVTGFATNSLGRHPLTGLKLTLAESAP
ncbi:ABC transporter substrate-binding protein [Sphingomicrobium marinum]|uniref:ABC transporter substrate-binding protein n=1 Tax=Sphingomicrobium marinum TaxID=1227950 RepID=UPI00223EE7BE|nr:ABC transporter substrate-binding protein [Sphingomicrobium marinum]